MSQFSFGMTADCYWHLLCVKFNFMKHALKIKSEQDKNRNQNEQNKSNHIHGGIKTAHKSGEVRKLSFTVNVIISCVLVLK